MAFCNANTKAGKKCRRVCEKIFSFKRYCKQHSVIELDDFDKSNLNNNIGTDKQSDHILKKISNLEHNLKEQKTKNNKLNKDLKSEKEKVQNLTRELQTVNSLWVEEVEFLEQEIEELSKQNIDVVKTVTVFEGESDAERALRCSVCLNNKVSVLLLPCKHIVMCGVCSLKINNSCPVCRTEIEYKITDIHMS